jgi:hypothetical protein
MTGGSPKGVAELRRPRRGCGVISDRHRMLRNDTVAGLTSTVGVGDLRNYQLMRSMSVIRRTDSVSTGKGEA